MSGDPLNPNQRGTNPGQRLMVLTVLFFGVMLLMNKFFPQEEPKPATPSETVSEAPASSASSTDSEAASDEKAPPILAETTVSERVVTLGSLDPKSPYRMLATFSNRGAALRRIELNDPKYYDIDTRHGWMGELVVDTINRGITISESSEPTDTKEGKTEDKVEGDPETIADGGVTISVTPDPKLERCLVETVGLGTPAQLAGIQVGDEILAVGGQEVHGFAGLNELLTQTKPGQVVTVRVRRSLSTNAATDTAATDTKTDVAADTPTDTATTDTATDVAADAAVTEEELSVTLAWKPVELIRPERDAPGSFLVTLQQVDNTVLEPAIPQPELDLKAIAPDPRKEISGVTLLNEPWEIETLTETEVVFLRTVPKYDLEIRKRFALVASEASQPTEAPAYRLDFSVSTKNVGTKTRTVAYRFDGPNGLPTEAWWYSQKVSREWGQSLGVRDIVYGVEHHAGYLNPFTIPARNVANGDVAEETELSLANAPLTYMGIDAVYFSVAMIPEYPSDVAVEDRECPFTKWRPVRYGPVETKHEHLANTSFVLTGKSVEIEPSSESNLTFQIFAGPKRAELLDAYGLTSLLYFGWFSWISKLLLGIMHVVTSVCPYVIGIIVLTVLVRMLIFPLSRVQAINSLKMQVIQPEMARVREKYKNDPMAMRQAQAALFKKYNFKPQMGCLLIFIQLPIFMGLWRGVMLDVEARGESLLGRGIAWCSDLSAPDRLFAWDTWMPKWLSDGSGWLGPYFNLLPLFVIILFLWQQNKMMPTPTDDQGRMQQKMMKFMMIFMGFLFFKVPSGLCIYMVIVTFWGVCERHFLPKSVTQDPAILAAQSNAVLDVRASDPKRRHSKKKKR